MFYSSTIFGFAGFHESILASACVGTVNLLVTIFAASNMDRKGPRYFLVIGAYIMMLALLVLSTALITDMPGEGIVAVLAVLLFITGFAVGPGAASWVLMATLMADELRVKAMSLFLSINWGCNLLIAMFTLTSIDALGHVQPGSDDTVKTEAEKTGVAILYYIFSGVTLCTILFIHFVVPQEAGGTDTIHHRAHSGGLSAMSTPVKGSKEGRKEDYLKTPLLSAERDNGKA
jgi:MFS family permease